MVLLSFNVNRQALEASEREAVIDRQVLEILVRPVGVENPFRRRGNRTGDGLEHVDDGVWRERAAEHGGTGHLRLLHIACNDQGRAFDSFSNAMARIRKQDVIRTVLDNEGVDSLRKDFGKKTYLVFPQAR